MEEETKKHTESHLVETKCECEDGQCVCTKKECSCEDGKCECKEEKHECKEGECSC